MATKTKNTKSVKRKAPLKRASNSISQAGKKKTLHQMFEHELQDIYSAEKQLIKALPAMVKAAENEDLKAAFEDHLEQTKKHAERLEKVSAHLRISLNGESCKAMEGLIEENNKIIKEFEKNAVRDSALIIGAQKVEHYEIAAYGSLCELADVLGYNRIHDVLGRTLDEEEETDELLTDIAIDVNDDAVEVGEYEEES